jgi:hypothetical protein
MRLQLRLDSAATVLAVEKSANEQVFEIDKKTTLKWPPESSEIPSRRRFVTHEFCAENLTVSSESRSIGRRPLKWLEGRRIKATFSRTTAYAKTWLDCELGRQR